MRHGFTTGSCSAAAAKAATYMLLSGKVKNSITIQTPKGIDFNAEIVDINRSEKEVSCGVVKDGGDDPDVTTGAVIKATVRFTAADEMNDRNQIDDAEKESQIQGDGTGPQILIDGGEGVGRVTSPGLDQPVGNAAINSVPRSMIEKEVREVTELFDYKGGLLVTISVPGGAEIAEKTFNPRLGIVGGISILGTSGIVEPMSMQAIKDTIRVEIRQQAALGHLKIAVAPGNYGMDFMRKQYDFDLDKTVKCSNFIGETIDMAAELGIQKLLLVGHIGKLIKVSGGIMNTHSREADCRMELMAALAMKAGCSAQTVSSILDALNTTEAFEMIKNEGKEASFSEEMMKKIAFYLEKRTAGRLEIQCIVFSNEEGLLGETEGARALLEEIKHG